MSTLEKLQGFVSSVWFQLALGLILLVVGWKMNAYSANGVLFLAWAILASCVFRSPWLIETETILRSLITMCFAGALGLAIYFTLWTCSKSQETRSTPLPLQDDFRMSVFSFNYQPETQELTAKVQYSNSDTSRRTVLGSVFFYRSKDANEQRPSVTAIGDIYGGGDPVYVEPNQPVIVPYKLKLSDTGPTRISGTAFGLMVTTVRKDGGMNQTSVEGMTVCEGFTTSGSGGLSWISNTKTNVSLNEEFKYVRMFNPLVILGSSNESPTQNVDVDANGAALEKPAPGQTPIEIVADLISQAETLEGFCADFSEGCKQRVDTFVSDARACLRQYAPDYIAAFNEAVSDPHPRDSYPRTKSGRTIEEIARWVSDKDREKAWRTISACVDRLKQIHALIRSKLPL